jgi:F0F1-type ATP synthase assembly protein I
VPAPASSHPTDTPGPGRKPPARGAVAGMILLSALVLCGALGALAGVLIGGLVIFLIAGILAGFVLGVFAVRTRFPDL